jgi:hypothetical protein
MKIKTLGTFIGSLLLLTAASYAETIYQGNFLNTNTTDQGLANVGWHANMGSSGTAANESNTAWVNGPVASAADYLFYMLPAMYAGQPALIWTDEPPLGAMYTVTNLSAVIRNSNPAASEDLKFAIKVNGAWYVSQTVFNSPKDVNATININVRSSSWNSLTLTPETTLVEDGAVSLPLSGTVQGVGLFDAQDSQNRVRILQFTVQGKKTGLGLYIVSLMGPLF